MFLDITNIWPSHFGLYKWQSATATVCRWLAIDFGGLTSKNVNNRVPSLPELHTRVLSLDNVRITEFGRGSLLNDLREIENSNYGRPQFCLSRKVALVHTISEKPCSGPWFSRARSPKKWWKKLSEHNFYEISLPKAWETDIVTGKRFLGPTFFSRQVSRLSPLT